MDRVIEELARRVEELEAALRQIASFSDTAVCFPSCGRDMRDTARAALNPRQNDGDGE